MVKKKEFTAITFNPKNEIFILVYITSFASSNVYSSNIYLSCKARIALLKANKALIIIFPKYTDFANVFFPNLVAKLLEYNEIYDYTIKLIKDKQLTYNLIYSLKLIELDILKMYFKINLANSFIKPSKFSGNILIFFI